MSRISEKTIMTSCFKTFATLSILVLAAGASAQFSKQVSVSGFATAANAGADDAATPAQTLRALQDMNQAAGDHLSASKRRISQMTEFLKSKGMLDAYNATDDPPKMLPQAMSFQDALNVAIQHEAANGSVDASTSTDPEVVSREIQAYTTMVQSVWAEYQQDMVTVQRMTDFLNANGVFDDYMSWAADLQKTDRDAMLSEAHKRAEADRAKQAERQKEVNQAIDKSWATYDKHHQEMLNTAWQHYKFNAKMRLKYYKYSQEYRHGYWNNYGDPYGDVYGY
ncbi:MAG: hypothetical protein VX727_07410 [Planctomycetota bacterium]|nr:hypothetical protein [Planctomycetota bacterium]